MLPTSGLDRKNAYHLYLDVFWYGVLHGSILTYIGVYAARLGATSPTPDPCKAPLKRHLHRTACVVPRPRHLRPGQVCRVPRQRDAGTVQVSGVGSPTRPKGYPPPSERGRML